MAYKCKDCGFTPDEKDAPNAYGTTYGDCPKCTPPELWEAESDYTDARVDHGKIWDARMAKKRLSYINIKTQENRQRVADIFNANKPAHVAAIKQEDLIPKLS